MKTILTATDFSEAASNAALYAANLALATNSNLYVLHVYQIPISYSELPLTVNVEELENDAKQELLKVQTDLLKRTQDKIQIQTEVREGIFFSELSEVCEKVNPFTVVIGTQGKTPTERLFFGSEAVYTMKHLNWPIIAVPPNSSYKAINKIGFACDFDHALDTTPLDEIKMLVKDFKAELHVLNTSKKEAHTLDVDTRSNVLFGLLADLKPEYHFITGKNVDEGTLDFAEKNEIDLLIVLPKRHSLISNLMLKSHTKEFVLHSHVPVMALHK